MMRRYALILMMASITMMTPHDAVAQEPTAILAESSRDVDITHAYLRVEDHGLRVAGRISRWHELSLPGHLVVTVSHPDGTVLGEKRVRVPGIMCQRKGCVRHPFSTRFDFVPPPGATVRVRYVWFPAALADEPRESIPGAGRE